MWYASGITYRPRADERGHWQDRLPAIDQDIAAMASRLQLFDCATRTTRRPCSERHPGSPGLAGRDFDCLHPTAPARFVPAEPLELTLSAREPAKQISERMYCRQLIRPKAVKLLRCNHEARDSQAAVPASYTPFETPPAVLFELKERRDRVSLHPGFAPDRARQPYFSRRPAV